MSVWDSLVGQRQVIEQLRAAVHSDGAQLAQSWLICGPPGSGRSNLARAFAAALESEDLGESEEPSKTTRLVLEGTHPDVTVLATDKVTIGIDDVRELIVTSEQTPSVAPWRIIIIEDVDRMLERTTNVLLKEIEEPSPRTIWLLCAPSAQDVLPTIRSRTRIVNLAVPASADIARFLETRYGVEPALARRAARLSEGHIGIAKLYAGVGDGKYDGTGDEHVLADRDELVVGVLGLHAASQAVLLAERLNESAKTQAQRDADKQVAAEQAQFRRINGLREGENVPTKLRGAYKQIGKKDEVKRRATRRVRDVLDRALNTVASVYRDVSVVQNDAEDSVGLINLENRDAIAELAVTLSRQDAVDRLARVDVARRRLAGNVSAQLVFEALFCALIP